jgi:hypothetical protein
LIPGPVDRDEINERLTFRRGIFEVPHVEIHPPGIREKASVPRRLIVSAMVQVEHPPMLGMKKVITDLVGKPCR